MQDFEALQSSLISSDELDEEQDTGDKASCLESRGGVHNFPRFGHKERL